MTFRKRLSSKYHERKSRANYGAALKGLGHSQLQNMRGFKGSTFGPASEGRTLSPEERAAVEDQLRKDGKL